MTQFTLFASPGSCSQISLIALEKAAADYVIHPVILAKGEHKTPDFKRINPKGKVPALGVGKTVITETPAILVYLHQQCPEAGLLPDTQSISLVEQISDLSFFASTLHPLITRLCKPELLADEGLESVAFKASESLASALEIANNRLQRQPYWYGKQWCALDAYLFWVVNRVKRCGFDINRLQNVAGHYQSMLSKAPVKRALLREQDFT